jgi:hypothetical protein
MRADNEINRNGSGNQRMEVELGEIIQFGPIIFLPPFEPGQPQE